MRSGLDELDDTILRLQSVFPVSSPSAHTCCQICLLLFLSGLTCYQSILASAELPQVPQGFKIMEGLREGRASLWVFISVRVVRQECVLLLPDSAMLLVMLDLLLLHIDYRGAFAKVAQSK